jgi:hypothetical protein
MTNRLSHALWKTVHLEHTRVLQLPDAEGGSETDDSFSDAVAMSLKSGPEIQNCTKQQDENKTHAVLQRVTNISSR